MGQALPVNEALGSSGPRGSHSGILFSVLSILLTFTKRNCVCLEILYPFQSQGQPQRILLDVGSGEATRSIRLEAKTHKERLYSTMKDLMRWQRGKAEITLCVHTRRCRPNTVK